MNYTLKGMTLIDLQNFVIDNQYPKYRAQQIYHWMYKKSVLQFSDMTNLPLDLQSFLKDKCTLTTLELYKKEKTNNTIKFIFKTNTNDYIESVSMIERDRHTICISSQVGCSVDCDFCATGKMGFKKNLTPGEIIDQLLLIQNYVEVPITNIVFMGMGEPFLNYNNVIIAANLMNDNEGLNFSYHRITISTSGIVNKIDQFIKDKIKYNLAISLNATDDKTREKLMPINKKWPIKTLLQCASKYNKLHKTGLTFEYVLIDSINDSDEDAKRLGMLLKNSGCKLNVIPFNEIGNVYNRPSINKIERFLNILYKQQKGFTVLVRWSKGTEINAGCGQLATEITNE